MITDTAQLEKICNDVLDNSPKNVRKYLNGKKEILEVFARKAVEAADRKAPTQLLTQTLERLLEERRNEK